MKPQIIYENTRKLALANVKWSKPNFHQPLIGDSDDTDLRGILTTAAFVLNDEELMFRAYPSMDYETSFVASIEEQQKYENMKIVPPTYNSVWLSASGNMIMRSDWGENASYMNVKLKKLADGHEHDDILHFSLFANGKDYLVDGGRFTYVDSPERERLKSSNGHNIPTVDNLPNSVYEESWGNKFNATDDGIFTVISEKFDYAEANNTAYQRLADPVNVKRRILFVKPALWVVFDAFYANGKHIYSNYFNFADESVTLSDNSATTTYEKDNLILEAINPTKSKLENYSWSPEYNLLQKNKRLQNSVETTGFHSFITALYFDPNTKIQKVEIKNRNNITLKDKKAEGLQINYNGKEYLLLVVHQLDAPVNPFYRIKNYYLTGEVVLAEKVGVHYEITVVKE